MKLSAALEYENIRREIFMQDHITRYGTFDSDMTTFTLRGKPTARLSA